MGCNSIVESLLSGSISSAFTTFIYQPLELLKTRIQLDKKLPTYNHLNIGKASKSAHHIVREHGFLHLWTGTGPSLVRSVPGVGLYYASLSALQSNFSHEGSKPDNASQAFYFGLASRSLVSLTLLPVTVVKVRYESGHYRYQSLFSALVEAYSSRGWVGIAPTILRDSLFSGIYYMCYTELNSNSATRHLDSETQVRSKQSEHLIKFKNGLLSGLVASVLTNPFDVLKTRIQAGKEPLDGGMLKLALRLMNEERGLIQLFDGLMPRCLRRTLIAASTWTFYEFLMDSMR